MDNEYQCKLRPIMKHLLPFNLKTITTFAVVLLTSLLTYSQVTVPFTVRYQRNLKGDMTMISNSIVNRQDSSNGPNVPYNLLGSASEYNDNFNMRYIDIDSDPSTFSSSSATLQLPTTGCNKIVYAGLYWSATYRFDIGNSTALGDGNNVRSNNFNQIKLKLPGSTTYQNITGSTIFDGFTNPNFIANSPYACFADITSLVTGLTNPEGAYTAANIRCTNGFINAGGVSGGWTIFFVYENPQLSGKYITAYDGFAGVRSSIGQTDVNFSGFTTLPAPFPVRAKLASAALEGDNKITGDQLQFKAASSTTFTPLSNTLNVANNFFNSRITLNDTDYLARNPNSLNTLGYDGDIITINNPLNSVLPNNETSATLRMTTTQDTYFMFFNALNVEIIEPKINLVKTIQDISGNNIGGAGVNLGQTIDYVLDFQNIGNDGAINTVIRDILPINTGFLSVDLTGAPGVTYTYNAGLRQLLFTVPNNLVEIGDPKYRIKIRVQVAQTCNDLEDACSNRIQNQAYITYRGVLNSSVVSNDPSYAGIDSCGYGASGPSNFIVDIDNCTFTSTAVLCGASVQLTAAAGYNSYAWTNSSGNPIGNTQTITVNAVGTYYVLNTANAPCVSINQTYTVTPYGTTTTNPVIPYADEVVICPNNGEQLPKIFLCGLNNTRLIQTGITDASSIVWETLNTASCTATPIVNCANTNPSCTWTQVGTGANFTITTAGQYRLTINYQNGCFKRFYFNVFRNLLDIQFTKRDIICSTNGNITITNLPTNYQFQLVNQSTNAILVPFQSNPSFTITQAGTYMVQVRQNGVNNGCVFEVRDIGIELRIFQVNVVPTHATCNGLGSIRLQALNVRPQYTFSLSGPVSLSSGLVTNNDYTFSNLNAGTYTYTVSTTDGCTQTGTVVIQNNNNLSLNATVSQNISCNQGNIQVNRSGGQPPFSYAIHSINGVTQTITASSYQTSVIFNIDFGQQGTYVFVVVDSNNCTSLSNPVTINLVPNVQYTTSVQNISCNGANNGSITYNVTSSNGYQLSYQLLNSSSNIITTNNSGVFTGLAAGTYTVNLIQTQGNKTCSFPQTFTITQPQPLTGTSVVTQNYTCTTNSGTIAIQPGSVTGGVSPYQYSINGIAYGTTSTFSGLTAGTYTIRVKDANGCIFNTNAITFNALNQPTAINFSATNITCPSLTSNVTLSVVGGNAPFNYQIIAPSGQVVNNGTNATFTGLLAGTYTFKVTDTNGCTFQNNYTITPITPINVLGQSVSNVVCFGANNGSVLFTVNSSSAYNYQVVNTAGTSIASANNSSLNTIPLNNLPASTYTITVTNPVTNCSSTANAIVNGPTTALTATNSVLPITCSSNGSVSINATGGWGGYQFQLTKPNGTISGPQSANTFINLNQTGTYTVQVTDTNGCVITNSFILATPTNPVATIASSSNLCYGVNGASLAISATGGVVPYTYSLNGNTPQSNNVFSNLTPGNYSIIVTDAFGCTATVSKTIQLQLTATASMVKGLDCSSTPNAQITTTLVGGLAPYTYQVSFNNGAFGTSTNITGTTFNYQTANAGTYQFLITDSQGCSFTTNTITVNALTTPSITSVVQTQSILCNGGSNAAITINTNPSLGLAPFTYVVNNTTTSTNYGNQTSGLTAGSYTITITDANSCSATSSIVINQPNPITFTVSTVDITCNNPGGTSFGQVVVQNVLGGIAPYTYYVNNNFGFQETYVTTTNESHSFQILDFGIYHVEVIDSNGCTVVRNNIIIASPPNDLTIDVSTSTSDCTNGGTAIITVTSLVSSGSFEFAILETNTLPYSTNYQPANAGTPETTTFTGLTPGVVYTFVVHDIITDCYYFKTADSPINTPSQLISTLNTVGNISCTGANDGFVSFTFSNYDSTSTSVKYEIFNSQSNISTGITGTSSSLTGSPVTVNNVGPLTTGTYYILFTELGGTLTGCSSASVSFSITQSTNLLQVTASVTKNDNCNPDKGQIVANGQYGTAPYQFQLVQAANPAPTVGTWIGSASNVFNIEGGNYVVYIKDANNCIQAAPVFVPTDPSPEITAAVTNLCTATQGGYSIQINLSVPGMAPYTFSLNNGAYQTQTVPSFNYTNLNSGTHTIKVKDVNACIFTTTVTITAPLALTSNVTSQPSCTNNDGIIVASATGGSGNYVYQLQNNSGTVLVPNQASTTFNNLASASYIVLVTDTTTNCTKQINVTLEPATGVSFTTQQTNVTCNGSDNGTLITILPSSNNNGPYTYTLTFGSNPSIVQNNGTFNDLVAGIYTLTVTSARNCQSTQTIEITQPTHIKINVTATNFSCTSNNVVQNAIVTISVENDAFGNPLGTPPFQYSINGTNYYQTNNFTVVNNGSTQTITGYVKDANNCTKSKDVIITPLPVITNSVVTNSTPITCTTDGVIQVSVSGGSGNFSFEMLPTGSQPIQNPGLGINTANFTITNAGNYTFQVTDLTTGCYVITTPIVINPIGVLQVVASNPTAITCFGNNNGTVTINISNYSGTYNYQVKNAAGTIVSNGSGTTTTNPMTLSGLIGGNYSVTIIATQTPFCSAISNVFTIESPSAAMVLNASQVASVTCSNNLGEIVANTTGGYGTYLYQLVNTSTSTTLQNFNANNAFNSLVAGNYTITVRDLNGCQATANLTLTQPAFIAATLSPSTTSLLCNGDTNASVSATNVIGGEGVYQFSLNIYDATGTTIETTSGSQISPIFNGLGIGTYSITITDGWNCDFTTSTVTITEPTIVVASLSVTSTLTCNTNAQLSLSANGGTAPYQYSVDGVTFNTTTTFSVGPGTYQYFVRDANGCAIASTNEVIINAIPALNVNLNLNGASINCFGDTSATIIADALGGLGNYTYSLLNSSNTVIQGPQSSGIFSGLGSGTYFVRVNSGDCIVTSTSIIINNPIELNVSTPVPTAISCNGEADGSITISANGGTGTIQYAISPNLNQFVTTNTFTGLAPGNYEVLTQDEAGCFQLHNVTIVEPAALSSSIINVTQELCSGDANGSFEVSILGGTAPYSTSLNSQEAADYVVGQTTFTGLTGGTDYFIFIKDANGCEDIAYIFLDAPVTINPTAAVTYSCTGNTPNNTVTVSVDASVNGSVQYSLDNGTYQSSNIFQNLTVGLHTVSVQHTNLCIKTVEVTIEDKQPLVLNLTNIQNILCNGQNTGSITASVTGGTGLIEYAFSTNPTAYSTQNVFSNLAAGSYTIFVRDALGCSTSQTIVITTPNAISIVPTITAQELCSGDNNASFTINVSGGVAPYASSLNVNTPSSYVANQMNFTGLSGGVTYTVYVRDANGCISQILVTLNAPVNINPTVNVVYSCNNNTVGNTVTVSVNATVTNAVTYKLDNGSYQNNSVFTNVVVGNHIIYVQHTNGCIKTVSFTINPSTPVQASFTATNITCNGLTNGSISISASGGVGVLTYAISPNLTTFGNTTVFNNLAAGNYTIIVKDTIGCEKTLNVVISQPQQLTATIAATFPDLCFGDHLGAFEIAITGGTAPYATSLNNTSNYIVNQTFFENLIGGQTYIVHVKDAKGCLTTVSVTIAGGVILDSEINLTYACSGDTNQNTVTVSVNPQVSNSVTYALDGGVPRTNNVFTNLSSGNHFVTVTHAQGCTEIVTFNVANAIPVSLVLTESNLNEITAIATGGNGEYTYYLNGNQMNSNVFNVTASGNYTVMVRDSNGCTNQAIIFINFIDIEIPNFFTPDGDGNNDLWHPINMQGFPSIQVEVHDRYGRTIIKFNKNGGWDGTYNGNPLPSGDYWWTVSLGDGRQLVGNVTLYR